MPIITPRDPGARDWGAREWARRNWWQIGVLTIAGWTAFYIAVIMPMQSHNTVATSRSLPPHSINWNDPVSLLRSPSWSGLLHPMGSAAPRYPLLLQKVAASRASLLSSGIVVDSPVPADASAEDSERKTVRTAELDLEVRNPAQSAEKIRALAEQMAGYVVNSEVSGDEQSPGAVINIRVPAARFEEARNAIKKLAVRVESEKADANDVTRDYVDRAARLRNLRAQETQYLAIMKRAVSVPDTLEVSSKLGEVRGQIEQQQAEFTALARQVATVGINISLRAEADAQVFGVYWHPLYRLKAAARDGVDSLASYASAMTTAIFELPAIILWLATITLIAAIAWRTMRWIGKKFFAVRGRAPETTKA